MQYVRLGNTGLRISRITLGSTLFGELMDEAQTTAVLHKAWDLGITTIDTGNIYAESRAETLIGKLVRERREQLVICTKVGFRIGDSPADHGMALSGRHDHFARWQQGIAPTDAGLSRKHIIKAAEDSLRRLQTDYIDLYQLHRWDMETPIEETLRALDDLVRGGKVRYIGCSNLAAWQLYEALWCADKHELPRMCSVQTPYSLLNRAAERELFTACEHADVGVIAYAVLAGGMLSGLHNEGARPGTAMAARTSYQQQVNPRIVAAVNGLIESGRKLGRSPVQLAVSAALKQKAVAAVTIGVQLPAEFEPLVAAVRQPLSDAEYTEVAQ
ncbi:MAG: aldo/keto reductase, partial [Spongiibacteraceae bacterium]